MSKPLFLIPLLILACGCEGGDKQEPVDSGADSGGETGQDSSDVDDDGDGFTENEGDCDDSDDSVHPGATDIPDNGVDEDCSGADEITAGAVDSDGDGFSENDGDCDDSDGSVYPGATEILNNGVDEDCSGADLTGLCSDSCNTPEWNGDGVCDDGGPHAVYGACNFGEDCTDCGPRHDPDGDGYYDDEGVAALSASLELDCDETDALINPGMLDIGQDGIDQDCSGDDESGLCSDTCIFSGDSACDDGGPYADFTVCDFGEDCSDCGARYDQDGDGYYDDEGTVPLDVTLVLDCDDSDAAIKPGGTEIPNDGVDQDCSGADEITGGAQCLETCGTSSDGSCDDGGTDSQGSSCGLGTDCTDCGDRHDSDLDGYDNSQDCNDADASIHPGVVTDVCDGVDNDCDGAIDQDWDTLEPNSSGLPFHLGGLDQSGDSLSVTSYMTHENDEDAFSLFLYDHADFLPPDEDDFYCAITPPAGVDIAVEVLYEGTSLGSGDNAGAGQAETLNYSSTFLVDDEGAYTIIVTNVSGSSCSPMTVYCEKP